MTGLIERFRARRLDLGLTQREVAERVGVSQPVYGRIETGRVNPRPSTIKALCLALELDPETQVPLPRRGAKSEASKFTPAALPGELGIVLESVVLRHEWEGDPNDLSPGTYSRKLYFKAIRSEVLEYLLKLNDRFQLDRSVLQRARTAVLELIYNAEDHLASPFQFQMLVAYMSNGSLVASVQNSAEKRDANQALLLLDEILTHRFKNPSGGISFIPAALDDKTKGGLGIWSITNLLRCDLSINFHEEDSSVWSLCVISPSQWGNGTSNPFSELQANHAQR